jgi:hypothetical protein
MILFQLHPNYCRASVHPISGGGCTRKKIRLIPADDHPALSLIGVMEPFREWHIAANLSRCSLERRYPKVEAMSELIDIDRLFNVATLTVNSSSCVYLVSALQAQTSRPH